MYNWNTLFSFIPFLQIYWTSVLLQVLFTIFCIINWYLVNLRVSYRKNLAITLFETVLKYDSKQFFALYQLSLMVFFTFLIPNTLRASVFSLSMHSHSIIATLTVIIGIEHIIIHTFILISINFIVVTQHRDFSVLSCKKNAID